MRLYYFGQQSADVAVLCGQSFLFFSFVICFCSYRVPVDLLYTSFEQGEGKPRVECRVYITEVVITLESSQMNPTNFGRVVRRAGLRAR